MEKEYNTKTPKDFTQAEIDELICNKYSLIKKCFIKQGLPLLDREDLAQETASLVYKYIHNLKDINKLDAWIREIAKNKYLEYLKNEYAQRMAFDSTRSIEEIIVSTDDQGAICDLLERTESNEMIRALLYKLKEPDITVFTLYYLHDYKLVEIAKLKAMNLNTVKSIHARGLKKLKKLLETEM